MTSAMEVFNKSSLNERIQQLCNKLESFGVYSDTWINLDTFFEFMNKTRDWRKLDKRIVLQVFNNTEKGLNGTFQIEKFFQTYQQTLNHLQQQKEAAEEYLKKLTNHKTEALKTLDTIQREETANPNQVNSESFLQIEIFEAKELDLNPGEQVYIRLSCEQTNVSTQLVPYLNTARWNERFKLPVRAGAENINILLIAKPISANGRVLGSVQVPLANLKDQQLQDNWFSLAYNDAANSSNKVRIGLQWIYSKTLYLQSTIDKIDQHMRNQVEDIEDYEKELIEMDNLIPLVVIDPILSQNELAVRSLVPDHLTPKRLNFETADILTNSLQSSPNFKPAMGITLSTPKILSKPAPQSQLTSPLVRMTLPTFDQQCSQDQVGKPLASSPRLLNERDSKPIKPQNQPYRLNILAGVNLNQSSSQSNKTFQTLNELPRCESKQNLDNNINEENQKLKAIIEDLKNENETLKQEKQKIASQIPDFEGKIHLLVSEVERLSRTVTEKNKEIETLKTQNEKSLREKASTESLDNKLRNVIGENMRLNQHLKRNKEPATGIEKTEQDENIKTQWSPAPRKNQIFSVGPKFHSIENGRIQSAPSQQEIEIPTSYTKQQAPLQIRENKQNISHTNGFKALMMNSNITFRNNYLQ